MKTFTDEDVTWEVMGGAFSLIEPSPLYLTKRAQTNYIPTPDDLIHAEMPLIQEQLDAIWGGPVEMEKMRQRIEAIKAAHPRTSANH